MNAFTAASRPGVFRLVILKYFLMQFWVLKCESKYSRKMRLLRVDSARASASLDSCYQFSVCFKGSACPPGSLNISLVTCTSDRPLTGLSFEYGGGFFAPGLDFQAHYVSLKVDWS